MPDLSALTARSFGGLSITAVAEAPSFLNILLYGDPGAGKTVLAGSADAVDEMRPVLVIDAEGGSYSLRSFYPEVDVVRVKTLQELSAVYNELAKGEHGYKTVVLDSLTEIQKMIMASIMVEVVRQDDERDPDIPSLREWGKNGEQVRRVIRHFRDLDMHVIFTALMDEDKDNKGRKKSFPMLPGKLKKEAPAFMDIVLYCYAKSVKVNAQGELDPDAEEAVHRFVLTSSTDEFACKDRSARLPGIMLDPDMQTIHNLIQGE